MKKRVISVFLALLLMVGLVPTAMIPTAQAAGITATITTSTTVGGYDRGNSYGNASSNDLRNCKWMCMEPSGTPPVKGHKFAIEQVGGLYRTFAWMAETTKNEDRLYNIHHCIAELNGTNNGIFFPEQKKIYKEAQNYDTSKIPADFIAFRGKPTTNAADQICLFWGRKPEGKVKLEKVSSDPSITNGNSAYSLAGAEYRIYRAKADAEAKRHSVAKLTTDARGRSNTVTLNAGKYYYRETKAPKGYKLRESIFSVTIIAGETKTIHATDIPQQGKANLLKQSSDPSITNGNGCYSLAGAEYRIYRSKADAEAKRHSVATLTTDANGKTKTITLPLGKYYYREIKAPKGYALKDSVFTLTIVAGETKTIHATDTPQLDPAAVMVKKRTSDGTGGKPLSGAEFTFRFYGGYYDTVEAAEDSGKPLRTWVFQTNETGAARYDQRFLLSGDPLYTDDRGKPNLPYGTLLIQETKAPEGYIIDPTVRLEQIKDETTGGGGTTPTLNTPIIPNTRYGRLVIEKTAINGSPEGWNFEVYDSNMKLLETITTGADGKAYSSYLDAGKYTVREVHDKDDKYWTYDVEADKTAEAVYDQDTIVQYTNEQFGRIAIKKTMDTDGPLDGWQFHIAGGPDNVDLMLTSGKDGTITSDKLRPGTYTVEEILPKGSLYVCKTENPQTITVVAGETGEVTFTNALRPGEITITKLASDTAQPLAGVKFCLEWSEDHGKTWQPVFYSDAADVVKGGCSNPDIVDGCLVTGEDGRLAWGNLYPGVSKDTLLQYRLTELETVDGYQLLSDVAWQGTLPTDTLEVSLNVVNSPIFIMPATGVNSWMFFAAATGVAVLCTVVFVCVKKRKSKN